MRYVYKWTSELTSVEIEQILNILNEAFGNWGDDAFYRWKFHENPYGDSLQAIGYDDSKPVAAVGFWRNGPHGLCSYQCVDAAVSPDYQRQGIYQTILRGCTDILKGSYIYTFTGDNSRPAMTRINWQFRRSIPLKFHLASVVLKKYLETQPIPDDYAAWRFSCNPQKKYYVYRKYGLTFLLSKRKSYLYAVAGIVSDDLNLEEVKPLFLASYDLPTLLIKIPRPGYYFIDYPIYKTFDGHIPSHYSDTF